MPAHLLWLSYLLPELVLNIKKLQTLKKKKKKGDATRKRCNTIILQRQQYCLLQQCLSGPVKASHLPV